MNLEINEKRTSIDDIYREECISIIDKYIKDFTLEDIENCYNEKHRFYHTNTHLNEIFYRIFNYEKTFSEKEREIMILSTLFHDIIYNPTSSKNEKNSVLFFKSKLKEENSVTDKVCVVILDTEFHSNKNKLSTIFNVFDMSVIYSKDIYVLMDWEVSIRKEFSHFSNEKYKRGRLKFLSNMDFATPELTQLTKFIKNYS